MNRTCSAILGIAFLFTSACKQDPLAKLPVFDVRLSDSTTIFNTGDIPKGRVSVIIHFSSDCRECQLETDTLLRNMEVLKNVQFYFLTVEKFSELTLFKDYYHLERYPNITIAQDYQQYFPRLFKSRSTPLLAIYDKRKNLVGVFEGKPTIAEFISKIKEIE